MATFIWGTSPGGTLDVTPRIVSSKFGDGYEQRVGDGINILPRKWNISFVSKSIEIADAIEAFLRARAKNGGIEPFNWTPPSDVRDSSNLLTYSEQLDNAIWTKQGTTISANAVTAPDGEATADKLIETAVTDEHETYQLNTAIPQVLQTFSVYLKAAERTKAIIRISDNVQGSLKALVDLAAGIIAYTTLVDSDGAWTQQSRSIVPVENGWYRASVTGKRNISTTSSPVVQCYDGNGASIYLGDITKGIYVWGAQLEVGSSASAYVPTVATGIAAAPTNNVWLCRSWKRTADTYNTATITAEFEEVFGEIVP